MSKRNTITYYYSIVVMVVVVIVIYYYYYGVKFAMYSFLGCPHTLTTNVKVCPHWQLDRDLIAIQPQRCPHLQLDHDSSDPHREVVSIAID